MSVSSHETCQQYVARRLSEGWRIISQDGFNVVLQSPWGMLRPVDLRNDVETLRPDSAGDECSIDSEVGAACPNHFQNVDDAGTGDYVFNYETQVFQRDLYNIEASAVGAGTINKITVFFRGKKDGASAAYGQASIKSDGTVTDGDAEGLQVAWQYDDHEWAQNPVGPANWEWADIATLQIGVTLKAFAATSTSAMCCEVKVEIDYTSVSLPTVTTQAATNVEDTTATGNGNITNTGGENCDIRGIVWDLATQGPPGNVAPAVSGYANDVPETNGFGAGAFTRNLVGLPTGDVIYCRAYAHNSAGYAYGAEVNFLTKPAAPANVQATDGVHTDKVVITWNKSTGATGYQVYRDGGGLGWLGDVATHDDAGADAPTITPGVATASDGTSVLHVTLSLAGESANNGTNHTYKVRARNATGESDDSGTNNGYRGVGGLNYQWQRSAADADAAFGNIGGATTDPYNDTGAPINGDGRWYLCLLNATGAAQAESTHNRGYRIGIWVGKISGVTNPAKVMGVANTSIASIKGVDSA